MSALLSLFGPRKQAGEITDLSNPALWLQEWSFGRRTASGERVSPESALSLPAYLAALRIVSGDVAKVVKRLHRKRDTRGSDLQDGHPVDDLLYDRWNPIHSSFDGFRILVHWVMGWGNGYAEIVRNGLGEAVELWPIHPSRITPRMADGHRVVYDWRHPDTKELVTLDARDVYHLRGLGDGLKGYSVVRHAAETLGLGQAAQLHAAAFFGEGMTKRPVFFLPEKMDPEGRRGLRRRIMGDRSNDAVGSRKIPIVDGISAGEVKEFGINPRDAQFIESMEFFGVADVSRITGCPLWLLSSDKTAKGWSTYDQQYQAYIDGTLVHHTEAIKAEGRLKLIREQDRRKFKIVVNFNSLLRADSKSRSEYLEKEWRAGRLTRNEGRELNDLNPIEDDPNADRYYITADLVPADLEDVEPTPEPAPIDAVEEVEDDEADDDVDAAGDDADEAPDDVEDEDAMARFRSAVEVARPAFDDAAARMVARESARLASAVKRYAGNAKRYNEWADKFHAEQAEAVRAAFAPAVSVVSGFASAHGLEIVGAVEVVAAEQEKLQQRAMADEADLVRAMAGAWFDAAVSAVQEVPDA